MFKVQGVLADLDAGMDKVTDKEVCVCVVVCVRVSVCMCVHMYSGLVVLLCILTCNSVYGQLVSCLRIVTILISLASKTFIRIEVFRSEFVRYIFFTR